MFILWTLLTSYSIHICVGFCLCIICTLCCYCPSQVCSWGPSLWRGSPSPFWRLAYRQGASCWTGIYYSEDIINVIAFNKTETNRDSVAMENEDFIRTMDQLLAGIPLKEICTDMHIQRPLWVSLYWDLHINECSTAAFKLPHVRVLLLCVTHSMAGIETREWSIPWTYGMEQNTWP